MSADPRLTQVAQFVGFRPAYVEFWLGPALPATVDLGNTLVIDLGPARNADMCHFVAGQFRALGVAVEERFLERSLAEGAPFLRLALAVVRRVRSTEITVLEAE